MCWQCKCFARVRIVISFEANNINKLLNIKLNIIKLLLLKYLPELGLKAIEWKVSGWAQEEIRVL